MKRKTYSFIAERSYVVRFFTDLMQRVSPKRLDWGGGLGGDEGIIYRGGPCIGEGSGDRLGP